MSYARTLSNKFSDEPKVPSDVATLTELHAHIESEYERRRKRPRVEESHQRVTFLLDRKLNERLNKLCDTRERGFKTLALNRAIEAVLREYAE